MPLSFPFLNDLRNAEKVQWPEVVRKHKITPEDIQKACEIVKADRLEEEWFNLLYQECLGCGLSRVEIVLEKYGVKENGIKERIVNRWIEGCNKGKGNN